jgi:hypothetical protein
MRTFLLIACLFAGGWIAAAPAKDATLDSDTEAKISAEALKKYSEAGDIRRYKTLIESLRKPLEELGPPARQLQLPVRSYPDGRPEAVLVAEEAWITLDTNYLRGRKVVVTHYNEKGDVVAVLTADEVAVDRPQMLAVAKGNVSGTMEGDYMAGNGALVDLNAKYMRIIKRAMIQTKRMGDVKLTERGIF